MTTFCSIHAGELRVEWRGKVAPARFEGISMVAMGCYVLFQLIFLFTVCHTEIPNFCPGTVEASLKQTLIFPLHILDFEKLLTGRVHILQIFFP